MDIHRCRFVPYPPSAINALAFSHPSSLASTSSDFPCLRLAIGRANGDIEIWNPIKGAWHQESVIHGGKDRSIEGLVWTQDPDDVDKHGVHIPGQLRLFSIGYSTAVTEWDLALGRARRHSSGNHGEAWCIAAQPKPWRGRSVSSVGQTSGIDGSDLQDQKLVVGCADGAIVLLSTADGDLHFLKTLAKPSKRKARVLSITFKDQHIVLAGHADSTIRVFDIRNGRQIQNITLGAGPRGGPKEVLVWSVRCLPNGWIVSGDSTGTVTFWDGKHYALVQRIQGHMADILDVVASADGETVISGGMDRRTTVYRRMGTGNTGQRRRWAEISHRRLHKHDVKAMATFETEDLSVLASGGLDTSPIMAPLRDFGKENHLSLSNLPQLPPVVGAPKERLMMSWWGSELRIWRFARRPPELDDKGEREALDVIHAKRLVARVLMQGDEALTCAELAADGSLLIACTISGVKVFRLLRKVGDGLKVSKLEVPESMAGTGAKIAKLSPDGKWLLLVRPDSEMEMYRVLRGEGPTNGLSLDPRAVHLKRLSRDHIKTRMQSGSLGKYKRSLSRVAFSANSRLLITGDLCGYLDSWVLEDHEDLKQGDDDADDADDAMNSSASSDDGTDDEQEQPRVVAGQRWIRNPAASLIPQLPAAPLILSFRPLRRQDASKVPCGDIADGGPIEEDRLFALTCDHQMYEFNVLSGKLSHWSRRNPTSSLPSKFRNVQERAKGLIWDVTKAKERIWVYGSSWLWMFDLSMDFPIEVEAGNDASRLDVAIKVNGRSGSKRKRGTLDTQEIQDRGTRNIDGVRRTRDSELSIGIGRKFRKAVGPEVVQGHWIDADGGSSLALDRDGDQADNDSALISLRRDPTRVPHSGTNAKGDFEPGNRELGETPNVVPVEGGRPQTSVPYWSTHKYRDILGIMPLGHRHEESEERAGLSIGHDELPGGVEVALIERPLWEVDLPPRYYGNQEWDR